MLSRMLSRRAVLETVAVEVFDGVDGQGMPSYAASQDIEARVVEMDELATDADGSDVRTSLQVWVPEGESPIPEEQDRLTRPSGSTFIAVTREEGKRINGDVVFVKVRARDE